MNDATSAPTIASAGSSIVSSLPQPLMRPRQHDWRDDVCLLATDREDEQYDPSLLPGHGWVVITGLVKHCPEAGLRHAQTVMRWIYVVCDAAVQRKAKVATMLSTTPATDSRSAATSDQLNGASAAHGPFVYIA
jgi:hypothetical protein